MEWSEIISYILDFKQWNISQLCEVTGFEYKYVHALKSGKSKNPKTDFIKALVKNVGINPSWLLTGDGQMVNSSTFEDGCAEQSVEGVQEEKSGTVSHLAREVEATSPSTPPALSGARVRGNRAVEISVEKSDSDLVLVDFYSQVAGAGPGREAEVHQKATPLEIMRRFLQPWRPEQTRALEARGDSMTKVGLFDRDIVLYVPEEKDGDGIFVISIENRMQVKRLEFDILGETLRIISENDRYEPRVLTSRAEIERVRIEGKVIGWLHRHPY